ncbi:Gfo/Idh/MocA family oxidoreductase [Paludisphaera sp.]|uniref:Gfo/Idh/MocA family protein n=1 Tax=Paludisphaera sp. TaxID=2017432 RepID=UPI00301D5EF8
MTERPSASDGASRRGFLKETAAVAGAAAIAASWAPMVHAGGSDIIKVGLVGSGGRGTGAAEQALTADKGNRLVAIADLFGDRLEESLSALRGSAVGGQVEIDQDRKYTGFDAYKQVIDQVDVVILASTPHFRPMHTAYAVEKGVHAFVEKPMAVDGPGLRKFLKAVQDAKAKNLAVVNGFCWRYHPPRRATMQQVFDGKIGEIRSIETTYNSSGVWEPRKTREECGSDMEYQQRNWYYYLWLSGDHIVEQAIHGLDTMGWAMGDKLPERCFGVGGRQTRTDAKYGNIYDHFSLVYEYEGGARGYHQCRHWVNTANQVKDYILGSEGTCDVFGNSISGKNKWSYRRDVGDRKTYDMYQVEHDEMYAALRKGEIINNGEQAAHSTLLGLMGRAAAYTGGIITPATILESEEDLSPAEYAFGSDPLPITPIPVPGFTKIL